MKLYERFADKEFHTSIATTFGIDFDAYESIVLPRLRGAGCRNNIVLSDSRMLTHALGGASALPRHAGKLYSVSGVGASGVFHPKIFLQVGRQRGRLIVSSANLTTPGLAGNLELAGMIACNSSDSGEQQLIAQAWGYLSHWCSGDQQAVNAQLDWMLARAPWLGRATPAEGLVRLNDGTLAALLTAGEATGIGERFATLIGETVSRMIVVSPYWDINLDALSHLAERISPGEISLLIDADCAVFPKQALHRLPGVRLYDRGDFRKGRFIHAKVIVAQTESADHVLVGSANCTLAALGQGDYPGSNAEGCMYRRLPPGSAAHALELAGVLTRERQIDPAAIPDLVLDEELPLDELAARNPGRFECRVDTLTWQPSAAHDPADSAIILLDQHGKPIPCLLLPLTGTAAPRFQITETQERPSFAQVRHRDGGLSAPAIVTLVDRLRAVVRETSSRRTDDALRQLEAETEASLLLLDVLSVLERIEQGERAAKEPISIPRAGREKVESEADYRKLSYEQFIAGRRPRVANQLPHSSLAGSEISVVRGYLNRIIGLAADEALVDEENEPRVPGNAFDMGDETDDAEAAINAGEDFDTQRTRREEERKKTEQRKAAVAKKATKEQIVAAASSFSQRIRTRKESGALDTHDLFRLRALLMIICTAGLPTAVRSKSSKGSRLQVLPSEGDPDSWPVVLGRSLFEVFGSKRPAIRQLSMTEEHDQIPDDIIECWATCYWCLQACLTVPLSPHERERIARYIKPLTELAYRLTLPTKEELLDTDVIGIMSLMSEAYGERLGINPEALANAHRTTAEALFPTRV